MANRLITIPFSHFCEKARWALERAGVAFAEDGHLPIFHYLPVKRAGAKRTVPVLVADGRLVADSTDIIAWADGQRPGSLYPIDARTRAEALALEDELDKALGPAARRWAYFHLLPRKDLDHIVTRGVPAWEVRALKLSRPIAVGMLKRGLNISAASVARSRTKIDETFDRVNALLRDGRRFLVGDTFTVADLTLAALAAPILVPRRNHPFPPPDTTVFPADAQDQIARWRDTATGRHALAMYETERG